MKTPEEIADELSCSATMMEDHAAAIAAEIYQPLANEVELLKKVVTRLTACLAVELSAVTAKSIINELNGAP